MANIHFYMTPGSCSTGLHILLEEAELVFEAYIVNLPAGDNRKPEYLAINPKGTIPALVTPEGEAITDFASIAYWIARQRPKLNLWPSDLMDQVRVLEVMNYAVNTLHMQGFTRIFTPDQYLLESQDLKRLEAQGKTLVKKGLSLLNQQLADSSYVLDKLSVADGALFYVEFWAEQIGIPLPENCRQHFDTMMKRPAVQQVMREEGYHSIAQRALAQ